MFDFSSWQWCVAQGFALVGLILVIISFQKKEAKQLLWYRISATSVVLVGLCFLGEVSAIIMCGAGVVRGGGCTICPVQA